MTEVTKSEASSQTKKFQTKRFQTKKFQTKNFQNGRYLLFWKFFCFIGNSYEARIDALAVREYAEAHSLFIQVSQTAGTAQVRYILSAMNKLSARCLKILRGQTYM